MVFQSIVPESKIDACVMNITGPRTVYSYTKMNISLKPASYLGRYIIHLELEDYVFVL